MGAEKMVSTSTKMNEQTVSVTLPGSSTLEFTSLENVPVYEPTHKGWIDLHYTSETITKINTWGEVTRLNVKTGRVERWYVRADIAFVVTMKMRDGVGGYYYEFAKDGSIRSSCAEGSYYWGPVTIELMKDPYEAHATVRDYMVEGYGDEIETLQDLHAQFVDKKAREGEEESKKYLYRDEAWLFAERSADERRELYGCDCCMDGEHQDEEDLSYLERPRLTDEERLAAIERWRDALKARLETMPVVRDSPAVREMHEQSIKTADKEIERLEKQVGGAKKPANYDPDYDRWCDDCGASPRRCLCVLYDTCTTCGKRELFCACQKVCPECKREGICMCYT